LDCDEAGLIQTFENSTSSFIGGIEERFNLSGQYADCKFNSESLKGELSKCATDVEVFKNAYVPKLDAARDLQICSSNLTFTGEKLQNALDDRFLYFIGGLAVMFAAYYMFTRKFGFDRGRPVAPTGAYRVDESRMEQIAKEHSDSKVEPAIESYKGKENKFLGRLRKKKKGG